MRGYLPMAKAELQAFIQSATVTVTQIFVPTERIAIESGASEFEEAEYGALEVARESAEGAKQSLILALELSAELIASGQEVLAGVVEGNFLITTADVVAFYRITDVEEELEWYDATESEAFLAKVDR